MLIMIRRTKHRTVGFVLGLAAPILFFFIAYFLQYSMFSPWQYLRFLVSHQVLSKVASLCVFPNLIVFFTAIGFDKDSVAHGVLFSTILWALAVAVLYFSF